MHADNSWTIHPQFGDLLFERLNSRIAKNGPLTVFSFTFDQAQALIERVLAMKKNQEVGYI